MKKTVIMSVVLEVDQYVDLREVRDDLFSLADAMSGIIAKDAYWANDDDDTVK